MTGDWSGMKIDRSSKTLREKTLEVMRNAILDSSLTPGERLVERTLCERLGVSRTVVREVLRHLESEGLVETVPHQGPSVARPDPRHAEEIYEIRELLEAEAAAACAARATLEDVAVLSQRVDAIEAAFATGPTRAIVDATSAFYETMFRIAGKAVAWTVVQSLNVRINHLRVVTIATPGRNLSAIAEMRRLVEAISVADPERAREASRAHVAQVRLLARAALSAD